MQILDGTLFKHDFIDLKMKEIEEYFRIFQNISK